jgi:hypothetical protein
MSQVKNTDSIGKSATNIDDDDIIIEDSLLSDRLFELQSSEQCCLCALDLVPLHVKAFFRLISVIVCNDDPPARYLADDPFFMLR